MITSRDTRLLTTVDSSRVRTITLNRPEKLNALCLELTDALGNEVRLAAADPSVHCLILTGSGRAFCAGADTNDFSRRRSDDVVLGPTGFLPCLEAFESCTKPIVAAVNGVAVGLGVTILGHCDIVLASEEATFRLPFVPMGLSPEAGASATLPQLVGYQETAHLLFTGRWFNAEYAERIGLVWRTHAPNELLSAAREVAGAIAQQPLSSLVETKHLLSETRNAAAKPAARREWTVLRSLLRAQRRSKA